ncbi:MAG: hypothetical protein ACRC8Y_22355 [Chroococcales cyanobacterium]
MTPSLATGYAQDFKASRERHLGRWHRKAIAFGPVSSSGQFKTQAPVIYSGR